MNRNLPMIPTTAHPVEEIYLATEDAVRALLLDDEYEIWLHRYENVRRIGETLYVERNRSRSGRMP